MIMSDTEDDAVVENSSEENTDEVTESENSESDEQEPLEVHLTGGVELTSSGAS